MKTSVDQIGKNKVRLAVEVPRDDIQRFVEQTYRKIAGEIRVPAFSMRNDPLIRKHAHAAILTGLRELDLREEDQKVIELYLGGTARIERPQAAS